MIGVLAKSTIYVSALLSFLLIATAMTPFLTKELQNRITLPTTAAPEVKITQVDVKKIDVTTYQISVSLESPASAYLIYKDTQSGISKTVLSLSGGQSQTTHVFKINGAGPKGGQATIMLNGINASPGGKPIEVK
ncbi:MAG: hypothetical protein UY21_C0018G0011 [Microgenomates group bacterium GW2011_GWA1_48_10]|uniref:Fibronectin type-III domain-containing protein n=1 Tax=Candidatus Gottesmanbacteria bacterium RIFCSPHIGHO2_01_FULL_47_48 TaxID=1798381 RepID=A0A1F6A528_9BACT|nr:MAG: hypothetical protein UY21_C0018G0011 [Microgenomates group bacterium GW2011_GWA1_48_10]OGG19377.1 MAG: hypothetical protein A2721_02515 [Candidatus Gottesmanbacteria bacterium RIFCSPHIGHO2_01_FULL_47_48]